MIFALFKSPHYALHNESLISKLYAREQKLLQLQVFAL